MTPMLTKEQIADGWIAHDGLALRSEPMKYGLLPQKAKQRWSHSSG